MPNRCFEHKYNAKTSHVCTPVQENSSDASSVSLSCFYTKSGLKIINVILEPDTIHLFVQCMDNHGVCPYCGAVSYKVHSKYSRTLVDLPILGKTVTIHMRSRKFFCPNKECKKRTFAEQPGNEVFRYRRRTRQCEVLVIKQGLYCCSYKAASLINTMGIPLCNTTVLRDIHRMNIDEYSPVERIGIDDWAFRKGLTYGSIIVNLDTGLVIDLLEDRNQDSFKTWLEKHQKVGLVSRDRSSGYSAAISSSGRSITQVADRFHLVKNMSQCVTRVISENYADYRTLVRGNQPVKQQPVKNDFRQVRFKEVKVLQSKGFKITSIAMRLGIARQTVRKYMAYEQLPARTGKTRNEYYKYDAYVENEYRHGKDLRKIYREIMIQGFTRKYHSIL